MTDEKQFPGFPTVGPPTPDYNSEQQRNARLAKRKNVVQTIKNRYGLPEGMRVYTKQEQQAGIPQQQGYGAIPKDWGKAIIRQQYNPNKAYFAQDPKRLAKFHYFLQSAPEGWQPPEWLDPQKYEQAFDYMRQLHGNDWTQWEQLEPDDPTSLYLTYLGDPPKEYRLPNEINQEEELLNYINSIPIGDNGLYSTQDMAQSELDKLKDSMYGDTAEPSPFLNPKTWEEYELWQQHHMSIFNPQPGVEDRPESSRFLASLFQGAQAGVGGWVAGTVGTALASALIGAAGGTALSPGVGTAVGAIGGLLVGGAATAQAYTGVEIPGINKILTALDIMAIAGERIAGLGMQALGDDTKEVFDNIIDIGKEDGKFKLFGPSVEAGEFAYESTGFGTKYLNAMSGLYQVAENINHFFGGDAEWSSGMKADVEAGEIWALERGIVEPYLRKDALLGGESLDQIRSRLIGGETLEDLYAEYVNYYGFSGTVGDFIMQSVLDPANLVPGMQGRAMQSIGKITSNPALLQSAKVNTGSIAVDILPPGTQWIGKKILSAVTGKKLEGSKGIMNIMQHYRDILRQGGIAEGNLPTMTVPVEEAIAVSNPNLFDDAGTSYLEIHDANLKDLADGRGAMLDIEGMKNDYKAYIEGKLESINVDITKAEVQKVIDSTVANIDDVVTNVLVNTDGDINVNLREAMIDHLHENVGMMRWGEGQQTIKYYPDLTKLDRRFAGVTEEGVIAELQPSSEPANWWQKLTRLTPESQAVTLQMMLFNNLSGILAMEDGNPAGQVGVLRQAGEVDPILVANAANGMLKSPATKTTAPIIKGYINSGKLDALYSSWVATNNIRTEFQALAKTLGLKDGTLQGHLKSNPQMVVNMINNIESAALDNVKGLTAEDLQAKFGVFVDESPIPFNENQFSAEIIMEINDFADEYFIERYGIKAKPAIFRLSSAMKSLMGLAVLGYNPLYMIYNGVNNLATRAAQGVFGLMTPKNIKSYWERFRMKPAGLDVGVGLANMPDESRLGGQAIAAAMDVDDWIGKFQKIGSKAAKLGVFSNWAAKIEVAESRQATTIGTMQAMDKLWRPGVGMEKLPAQVEAELRLIHPEAPEFIYSMAQQGLNVDEITKQIYTESRFMGVQSVLDRALEQIATDHPEVTRDLITKFGIKETLIDLIGSEPTIDDIQNAFDYLESHSDAIVEKAYFEDLRAIPDDVKNRIYAEGASASMPLWGEMWSARTAWRLQDHIDNQIVASVADAYRAQGDIAAARQIWRAREIVRKQQWARRNVETLVTVKSIVDAIGTTNENAQVYVNLMSDWIDGWDEFYAKRDDINHKWITDEITWDNRTKQMTRLYDEHTGKEKMQMLSMFESLGKWYEETSHRPASEVLTWGEGVVKAWDQATNAVKEFRNSIDNTDLTATERRRAFQTFNTETFAPLIKAQQQAMIEGAQFLSKIQPPYQPDTPNVPLLTAGEGGQQVSGGITPPSVRFANAVDLKNEINTRANNIGDVVVTDKQRNLVAALLSEMFHDDVSRHAVQLYLFDTQSIKMAKPSKIKAALDLFVSIDEQGNEVYTIPENLRGSLQEALELAMGQYALNINIEDLKPSDTASESEKAQYNELRIIKEADQAVADQAVHADAVMTRNAFKEKIRTAFNLGRKQQTAVMALVDAHAEIWGKRNGKSADAWFAQFESVDRLDADYGEKGIFAYGYTELLDNGKYIVMGLNKADLSTAVHELAHVFRYELDPNEIRTFAEWAGYENVDEFIKLDQKWRESGLERSNLEKYKVANEKFAKGFEQYLMNELALDVAPPAMINIFKKFGDWLKTIYNSLTGDNKLDVDISPEMKNLFDRLIFDQDMVDARRNASQKLKYTPIGHKTIAIGANTHTKYNMQYRIVNLLDLITSHTTGFQINPLFPQELQARFRHLLTNQSQVWKIINEFVPLEMIWDTGMTEVGPVIIGPDMVVESGNGRAIALLLMTKDFPDKWNSYVDALKTKLDDIGFTEESLEGIEYPVLVRQRLDDVDRIAFTDDANGKRTGGFTTLEEAYVDSKFWDANLLASLNIYATTDIDAILKTLNNEKSTQGFLDNIPQNRKAEFLASEGGGFSDAGIDKMKASLFARVFKDENGQRLITYFYEKSKSELIAKNVRSALENVMGEIAKIEGMIEIGRMPEEMSIANDVSDVVNALLTINRRYGSFNEFIKQWENQPSIFGDAYVDIGLVEPNATPETRKYKIDLLQFYADNARKVDPQTQLWKRYANKVFNEPQYLEGQIGMFDGERTPKHQIIRMTLQDLVNEGVTGEFGDYKANLQSGLPLETTPQTKPEGLSDFQSERIERAFQRSAYDNKNIELFEGIPSDKSYEYAYYSPSRPIDGMSFRLDKEFQLSDEGNFVFTQEPLTIDEVVKNELAPHSRKSQVDLFKNYYEKKYGMTDRFVVGNADTLKGQIVTKSTTKDGGWRVTQFDEKGFIGHQEYNSLDEAIGNSIFPLPRPQPPSWFEKVAQSWPDQKRTLHQERVITEVPQGGTPIPQYEGRMLNEVYTENLKQLLDQMREISLDDMEGGQAFALGNLPENLNNEIQGWLQKMPQHLATTKLTAMRYGEMNRNRALLNYRKRYGIDDIANMIFPYQFWFTRTMGEWGKRMIEKPAWISMYARIRRAQERMEQEGIPSRLKGKVRLPAPYLPDWMGDALYIDPFNQLFPFAQFATPFEMTAQQGMNVEYAAIQKVMEYVETKGLTATQAKKIIEEKSDPIWNEALAEAQSELQDSGDLNAMNLTSMMMTPAMWWTYPYHILKGTPEQLYPLPGTRTGQALRTLGGPLGVIGNIMALPEETLRKKFNLSNYGEWGDYYVDRALANLAAEGEITADEARLAMIDRQGPAYDLAYRRVEEEMSMKIPGSQTAQAIREGKFGGILYTLPTTLFPAGILPEGELIQRGLKYEYGKAWEDYENGNPEAINKFFEDHPEYQARIALFKEPEERLQQFLVSEIWDKWHELDNRNKPLVVDQLGPEFETYFLDEETKDYTAIKPETLATWAQMLGGVAPESVKSDIHIGGLQLYKPQVLKEVEEFNNQRTEQFPNYRFLQDVYWQLPEDSRKQFVDSYPEYKEYLDWKDEYYKAHPNVKAYQEEQQKLYEDSNDIYTNTLYPEPEQSYEQTTADAVAWNMIPALQAQVMFAYYSGQDVSGGARTMLRDIWESYGAPGDFDEWAKLVFNSLIE